MRTSAKRLAIALLAAGLAKTASGCADRVYDGSQPFYDQHPDYRGKPDYMSPQDPDDAAAQKNRAW